MGVWERLIGKPTRDDFAKMVVRALGKAGEIRPFRYEADQFRLRLDDTGVTYLGNFYDEYMAAPRGGRAAILERLVRMVRGQTESAPKAGAGGGTLLPRVRDRMFYAAMPLQLELDGFPPRTFFFKPVAEHLAAGILRDFPDHIAEMAADEIGMDVDEAFDAAMKNLAAMSDRRFDVVGAGLYVSPWQDNHDPARMLLVDRVRRLNVRGDPVVAVANRDVLLVTGTDDVVGLAAMAGALRDLMKKPRFLSSIPVSLLDRDTWVPFVPDAEHPLRAEYDELRLLQLAGDYQHQKELLERKHARDGESLFVATYTLAQKKDAPMFSYAVWSRDVRTILPRSDRIALVGAGDAEPLLASWDRVTEVAGARMTPVDLYPPRWLVDSYPDDTELAALRSS
jgi:hypothetical protein